MSEADELKIRFEEEFREEIQNVIMRTKRKWIAKLSGFQRTTEELLRLQNVVYVNLEKPTPEEIEEQLKIDNIKNFILACENEVKSKFGTDLNPLIISILQDVITQLSS